MNEIITGDCLEVMRDLPDASVDMVLCDLPYGTTACKWDTIIPLDELWEAYERLLKPDGIVVLTAQQPFTTDLINSKREWFRYAWVWDKHIPRGFQVAKYKPMNRHEDVLVFSEKPPRYNPQMEPREKPVKYKNYGSSPVVATDLKSDKQRTPTHKHPDTIIQGLWEANRGKLHPTQKPVALFEYLIRTYTNEGDVVLDNCIGGGTTAVAALRTGRNFIGIEQDPDYCDIARERIAQVQPRLLTPTPPSRGFSLEST